MTVDTWVPDGQPAGLGELGELDFYVFQSTRVLANHAQLDIWYFDDGGRNTLTLEGLRNGVVVASTSFAELPPTSQFLHVGLSLDGGPYDTFRLLSSGPDNDGHSSFVFDNVIVRTTLEPSTLTLVAVGGLVLLARRRRWLRETDATYDMALPYTVAANRDIA